MRRGLSIFAAGAILVAQVGHLKAADNLRAAFEVKPLVGSGKPQLGTFVEITLRYRDLVTNRAVNDVEPAVWLRRSDADRPACVEAARAFRITRALGRFDIPLFGAWLAVTGRENTLSLIDPKIEFQGSNLVSVAQLPGSPIHLEQDRRSLSLVVSMQNAPPRQLALPDVTNTLDVAPRPWQAFLPLPDGGWIADQQGNLVAYMADGTKRILVEGYSSWSLVSIAKSPRFPPSLLAVNANGEGLWLDLMTFEKIATPKFSASSRFRAMPGAFIGFRKDTAELALHYRDAPSFATTVALGFVPQDASIALDGTFAFVWSNAANKAELVDLAFGKVIQGFDFGDAGIASVAFAGNTVFIGHAKGMQISILDLLPLKTGGAALLRGFVLGTAAGSGAVEMRAVGQNGEAFAFERNGAVLFALNGDAGHPNPIEGTIPLKGTLARDVFVVDRGLVFQGDGTFSGVVKLPDQGPLELVATTGTGGTTTCQAVEVEGSASKPAREPVRLSWIGTTDIVSGKPAELLFALKNIPHDMVQPDSISATILALSGTFARSVTLVRQKDGSYASSFRFPAKGVYPMVFNEGSSMVGAEPVVIEVMQ